jgi:hypothetical protein
MHCGNFRNELLRRNAAYLNDGFEHRRERLVPELDPIKERVVEVSNQSGFFRLHSVSSSAARKIRAVRVLTNDAHVRILFAWLSRLSVKHATKVGASACAARGCHRTEWRGAGASAGMTRNSTYRPWFWRRGRHSRWGAAGEPVEVPALRFTEQRASQGAV